MGLSAFRLVALVAAVAALGRAFGPLGACAGVGVAFTLHALASAVYVVSHDGLPGPALLAAIARPLAACVTLAVAAHGVTSLGLESPFVALGSQIIAGALGYLAGVWLFARPLAQDLLRLVSDLRRRAAPPVG
jgi:lipopolysaccharide exporter